MLSHAPRKAAALPASSPGPLASVPSSGIGIARAPRGGAVAVLAEAGDEEVEEALALLGASVVRCGLFENPVYSAHALQDGDQRSTSLRALVVDAGGRPELGVRALRALRASGDVAGVPALLVLPERQVAALTPGHGFEDFLVKPFFASDLYARLRHLEWRASEFLSDDHLKLGGLHIDRAARVATIEGRAIALTAKEYKLLSYFATHLGKSLPRTQLLAQVWGPAYEGSSKTVDIHIRRLRMKLGVHFPLETRRGLGYVLPQPASFAKVAR